MTSHTKNDSSPEPAPPSRFPGRAGWRYALGLGLILLALVTGWYYSSGKVKGGYPVFQALPLDDAYIHMVYARSLGQRARFEYNQGSPEAGMTSLLWVILESPFISAARVLDLSPVNAVHLANQLIALALAVSAAAWARHSFSSLALGCLAGVAVLFEPSLGFSRFGGMEVLLGAGLLVAAYHYWDRERHGLAGAFFALAVLTRPENFILFGLCLVAELFTPGRARRWAWLLTPAALACGLWALLNYSASGRPLPNTFYAKSRLHLDLVEAGALVRHMVFQLPYFKWVAGFLLYLVGCGLMIRERRLRALPALIFPWVFILGLASSRDFVCFWAYVFHRYFQPCIPFLLVPWLAGAWLVGKETIRRLRARPRPHQLALLAAGLALVLCSILPWPARMAHWRALLSWNCSNIHDIQVRIGRWVAKNTEPDDVIAVKDAGAIRFYGERYTLDMGGLNSHRALDDPAAEVLRLRPGYIVLPHQRTDPPHSSRNWHQSRLGPRAKVWLRPVFSAKAERYTVTEGYPNRQTVYEIAYEPR